MGDNDGLDGLDKINIYSNEDQRLHSLGVAITTEKSRKILFSIMSKAKTPSEIAVETGFSLPLINHHLNTMKSAGLIESKGIKQSDQKYSMIVYYAKPAILILPQKAADVAVNDKTFLDSLKNILRFTSIGISGIITWFLTQPKSLGENAGGFAEVDPLIPSLLIITVGLIIERSWSARKKTIKNI